MIRIYKVVFIFFLFQFQISQLLAQQQIISHVFGSGGGQLQSGNYRIASTVGQSAIGSVQSHEFQKNIGYWHQTGLSGGPPTSIEDLEEIPNEFVLEQNYPNPFNPSTQIRFSIPEHSHVNLSVYNLLGQHITTLVNENRNPGWYDVTFDASGLSSGMFIYRIEARNHVETRHMMFVK